MGYHALVFCADEKTVRGVTQALNELGFGVESCSEPFAAVKRLTAKHFDALVVDCDNEQNATLLFKTARNSEINNASLSVAVVQGQAGIAKAFRIGANLVFTKPINVEQSKATLRAARGLMRKTEASKLAAAALNDKQHPMESVIEEAQSSPAVSEGPVFLAPITAPPLIPLAPSPTAAFEVAQEQSPKPGAKEAAMLESMPSPALANAEDPATSSVSKASSSQPESNRKPDSKVERSILPKSPSTADKASPAAGRAQVSQLSLAVAEAKDSRRAESSKSSGDASAAAVARAKEIPQPVSDSLPPAPTAVSPEGKPADAKKTPAKWSPNQGKTAAAQLADKKGAPGFGWLDAARDQQSAGGPGEKRKFFIAAALVLGLAAAGYYSWPRLEPLLTGLPLVQKYLGPGTVSPPPAPVAAAPAGATNQTAATESAAGVVQQGARSTGTSANPEALSAAAGPTSPQNNSSITTSDNRNADASPSAGAGTQVAMGSNSSPADPKSAAPLSISQTVSEALLLKKTDPTYPILARRSGIAGKVQLQADIGKDGSVSQVKALSGHPMLVRSAIDAVRQWKYKPYSVNGQPVEVETQVTVSYTLPN